MIGAIALLLVCQLAGEIIHRLTGLPLPGSVIGMVLLLAVYKLNSRLVDTIARELASKRETRNEAGHLSPAIHSATQE